MFTPTRTPEGEPNCCSVCGASFALEPSIGSRDAPCPQCGSLAWFAGAGEDEFFAGVLPQRGMFVLLPRSCKAPRPTPPVWIPAHRRSLARAIKTRPFAGFGRTWLRIPRAVGQAIAQLLAK
ncbi:MAG: hypothetical protein KDA44_08615 [Planctomycetales bacterium]|nr:hypothetical protein [Planctomycetales bacterium]